MCSVYTEYAQFAPSPPPPDALLIDTFLLIWVPYMGIKLNRKNIDWLNHFYPLDVVSHIPHMLIYGWMIDMYM